ncbi:hypothetical protein C8F04DRAFT_1277652 [Mycena alexandri]|uniref:Uncharacterized protein n=1 Tax=Mycena alexandri TaxID=1745969 RepID=A0AAD6S056_9AGAR|nr:hypothetical protein C8F04DRAFT_1277652 [Mycena alexandri]
MVKIILGQLLSLENSNDLKIIVKNWAFSAAYTAPLFQLIQKLQDTTNAQREEARLKKNRKQRKTHQARKGVYDSELEDGEEDKQSEAPSSSDEELEHYPPSSPIPPPAKHPKRVLTAVTNERVYTRAKAPRKKQESAAAVAQSFRAPYQTSRRRVAQ